jgi:hypothetical protein
MTPAKRITLTLLYAVGILGWLLVRIVCGGVWVIVRGMLTGPRRRRMYRPRPGAYGGAR